MSLSPGVVVVDQDGAADAGSVGTLARAIFDAFVTYTPADAVSGAGYVYWRQHAALRANIHARGYADSYSAGSAGDLPPFADLAALAAFDVSYVVDGSRAYVREVEDVYVMERTTTHTADGLCVVTANGAVSGYWVSRAVGRWDDLKATCHCRTRSPHSRRKRIGTPRCASST